MNRRDYRIGRKEKSPSMLPRKLKNVTNLYEKVKSYVLLLRDIPKKDYRKKTGYEYLTITKEFLASKFQVNEHEIEQCFQKLNQEGLLSQAQKRFAHDTNRNYFFGGPSSGWASDTYQILPNNHAIFKAVQKQDYQKLETLIPLHGIETTDHNGRSLLHIARVPKMVEFLLQKGAHVDAKDLEGQTALFYTTFDKSFLSPCFDLLLEQTSDVNTNDNEGFTLLFYIVMNQDEVRLKKLLQRKPNLTCTYQNDKNILMTSIETSIERHHYEVTKILMEQKKINLNYKDDYGQSALDYAIERNNKKIIALFLDQEDKLNEEERRKLKSIRLRILF